ncbi:MAG: hypothetical protein LAT82_02625 [Nanoarchaeota archaeon]|nr:hypothetical protein [Nanoarchaeota archaeon]
MRLLYLIIVVFAILFSLSFADTNGIWTYPEDIRAGVFGADEGLTSVESFTFNNIVYFNANIISNSTIQSDVDIIGNRFVDIENSSYFLNPSSVSNVHRIVAERYFSPSTNTLFLNPAGLSRISELEVQGNINLGGTLMSGEVPWSRLSGHPSILAGAGLVGGGALNENRTLSLESSYLDGSVYDSRFVNEGQINSISTLMIQNDAITSAKIASNSVRLNELDTSSVDSRYVNREGDSMTGILDMNNNRITNVGTPINNNDVTTKEYVDTQISSSSSSGELSCITRTNSGNVRSTVFCQGNEIMTGGGCSGSSTDHYVASRPEGDNGWFCENWNTQTRTKIAHVRCCTMS